MTPDPTPRRRGLLVSVAVVGGLLLVAGTVAVGLTIPRHLRPEPPAASCWNGITTDPCLPLEGFTGATWAFDLDRVATADCDRLPADDYAPEAAEAWHCTWPDLDVDVVVARFPSVDDGPALWRDISAANGFREVDPERWPRGEALGPGFVGSTPMTKDLDAPLLALCYDDIPYCVEMDAMSADGLETAQDRVATLTGHEVEAYLRQLGATPSGDV
ncbi:hypothetical protein [Cellulomonas sp. ICMP 17802]|uniref:hypothetical protein n=1 Tax=Cellulomonas sp. ICMP 17802 TaxID=3239199 RepID=UPI00351AFDB2